MNKKLLIVLVLIEATITGCSKPAEATKVDPAVKVNSLIEEGKKLNENGAYDSAIEKMKQALAIDENNITALRWVRSIYSAKGDSEKAAEYAGILLSKDNKDKDNYAILAGHHSKKKNSALAGKFIKLYMENGGDRATAESFTSELLLSKSTVNLTQAEKAAVVEHLDSILKQ